MASYKTLPENASSLLFWTIESGNTSIKWRAYRPQLQDNRPTPYPRRYFEPIAERVLYWSDLKAFNAKDYASLIAQSFAAEFSQFDLLMGQAFRGGIAVTNPRMIAPTELCEALGQLDVTPRLGWSVIDQNHLRGCLQRLDVSTSYSQDVTIGLDRLLSALAACHTFGAQQDALVLISAGTALTMDCLFVMPSSHCQLLLGGILPGVERLRNALSDILPVVSQMPSQQYFPARTTEESCSNGLYWLLSGALTEAILQMQAAVSSRGQNPAEVLKIIVCGGDTDGVVAILSEKISSGALSGGLSPSDLIPLHDWPSQGIVWALLHMNA
ncbi:MAG: type III pantothenate kinase [Vampirovibrionales bacterium]|nr:type III pantothenate kinase [Vampirovibrionales bacterium]